MTDTTRPRMSHSDRLALGFFGVVVDGAADRFGWRLFERGEVMIGLAVTGLVAELDAPCIETVRVARRVAQACPLLRRDLSGCGVNDWHERRSTRAFPGHHAGRRSESPPPHRRLIGPKECSPHSTTWF